MTLTAFEFAPGIVADDTDTASEGRYTAADGVRFRRGKPEQIGGWEAATTSMVSGVCRGLYAWADNDGAAQVAIGTHTQLYAYSGGGLYDITPSGLAAGNADGTGGAGYGTGTYGTGTYGTSSSVQYYPRTWSLDNWGEYLVACPRGGGIYQWDLTTTNDATVITNAPTENASIFVAPQRILVACGSQEYGGTTYSPMLVRWSGQDDNTVWTPSATNQAGEFPLSDGNRIVRGLAGRSENLIFTDEALVSMRYDASSGYVFTFNTVGGGCGLIGPNAVAVKDGNAFWMTNGGQFYVYGGGAVQALDCPVRGEVFDHLSYVQADKIYAWSNSAFGEIWWVYPDVRDGNEISRYVAYNYAEGTWTTGTTTRTAWCDAGAWPSPMAVDYSGALYFHERGNSANGGVLPWSLSTGYTDMGDGDNLVQLAGLRPDFKDLQGAVSLTVLTRSDPQATPTSHGPYAISASTTKVDIRATGRQIALQWSGTGAPASFRMGAPRFDVKPLGARR